MSLTIVEQTSSGAMNRDRPRNDAQFVRFGPDPRDGLEVFVTPNVLKTITQQTRQASPNETIGLLAGRRGKDLQGPFMILTTVEAAAAGEAETTPGSVRLPQVMRRKIEQRLLDTSPLSDIIGWWHSHPDCDAYFSDTDKQEQATWSDDCMVGIVVSGLENGDPFAVFRGPEAIQLPRATDLPPLKEKCVRQLQPVSAATPNVLLPLNIQVKMASTDVAVQLGEAMLIDQQALRLLRGLIALAMLMLLPGVILNLLAWLLWYLIRSEMALF